MTHTNEPITIYETPEMSNWLHPQTEERKAILRKNRDEAIARLRAHRAEQAKRPIGRLMDYKKEGERHETHK